LPIYGSGGGSPLSYSAWGGRRRDAARALAALLWTAFLHRGAPCRTVPRRAYQAIAQRNWISTRLLRRPHVSRRLQRNSVCRISALPLYRARPQPRRSHGRACCPLCTALSGTNLRFYPTADHW